MGPMPRFTRSSGQFLSLYTYTFLNLPFQTVFLLIRRSKQYISFSIKGPSPAATSNTSAAILTASINDTKTILLGWVLPWKLWMPMPLPALFTILTILSSWRSNKTAWMEGQNFRNSHVELSWEGIEISPNAKSFFHSPLEAGAGLSAFLTIYFDVSTSYTDFPLSKSRVSYTYLSDLLREATAMLHLAVIRCNSPCILECWRWKMIRS